MDSKHITSHSLRHLLTLTEKKEQCLKGIEEVENEIARVLKSPVTTDMVNDLTLTMMGRALFYHIATYGKCSLGTALKKYWKNVQACNDSALEAQDCASYQLEDCLEFGIRSGFFVPVDREKVVACIHWPHAIEGSIFTETDIEDQEKCEQKLRSLPLGQLMNEFLLEFEWMTDVMEGLGDNYIKKYCDCTHNKLEWVFSNPSVYKKHLADVAIMRGNDPYFKELRVTGSNKSHSKCG